MFVLYKNPGVLNAGAHPGSRRQVDDCIQRAHILCQGIHLLHLGNIHPLEGKPGQLLQHAQPVIFQAHIVGIVQVINPDNSVPFCQ